jgi:hypothetical protein
MLVLFWLAHCPRPLQYMFPNCEVVLDPADFGRKSTSSKVAKAFISLDPSRLIKATLALTILLVCHLV